MTALSKIRPGGRRAVTLRGRPELYTEYAADQALLNTPAKRRFAAVLLLALVVLPLFLDRDLNGLLTRVFIT